MKQKNPNYHNNPLLTPVSQTLRRNMTKEERHLWYDFLKLLPLTVKRQKVIDNYIVDFCIPSVRIVIELDGNYHFNPQGQRHDKIRDEHLQKLGYVVLRYNNSLINSDFNAVCDDIEKHINSHKTPPPAQMSRGGFNHSGSTAMGNCGFARLYRQISRIIACSASPGVEAGQTMYQPV